MLERSRKVAVQVCHGKGNSLLLSYPAPCFSLEFATGTGLGQVMSFSPGYMRFCRWRDWEKRGHSWLAQVGLSNWERPICCSRWSVAPEKCECSPEYEEVVFLSNECVWVCLTAMPADPALQHSREKKEKLVVNLLRAEEHWSVCIQLANGQEKFS